MNRSEAIARLYKRECQSSRIPIARLVQSDVFETHEGMLGCVVKVSGLAFMTENNSSINESNDRWHQSLLQLPETLSILVTQCRSPMMESLSGEFTNPLAQRLDREYQEGLRCVSHYQNTLYVTIMTAKPLLKKTAGLGGFVARLQRKTLSQGRDAWREKKLAELLLGVRQLVSALSFMGARLLGESRSGDNELLAFLSTVSNLGVSPAFKTPAELPANLIARHGGKLQPDYLNGYLAQTRLHFGCAIQAETSTGTVFAAMLSIKQYPSVSAPTLFGPLSTLDAQCIITHSFSPILKSSALDKMLRHHNKMVSVEDAAHSQLDALASARDDVASDRVRMGLHHHTVMVMSDSVESLNSKVRDATRLLNEAGIVVVCEDIGLEPAFWAQIPGNHRYILRGSLISSRNFTDFAPLHNIRTGFIDGNHLGSAVTTLLTPARTPFYFNYHAKGDGSSPTKGHAMVIGGNGAGKTVLLSFLDAQLSKYDNKTFFFDRNRGAETYIRAMGGQYLTVSPESPLPLNPFDCIDTVSNRHHCLELLGLLVRRDGESHTPAYLMESLKACVDYAFDALPQESRQLRFILNRLPADFERRSELALWVDTEESAGAYGYLFDNPRDALHLTDKMGFDMTHFLDKEPEHVRTPLLFHLFHRIEQSLDGRLVSILLDEGWQYLSDAYWSSYLARWLPTLRKLNAHVVLATQSPASVVGSPIRHQLLDNSAAQLFFMNPKAKREHYIDGFELRESEFEIIHGNSPASRLLLIKQEHESHLVRFDLSNLSAWLPVLSSSVTSLKRLDALRAQFGDAPENWVPQLLEGETK